MSEDTSKPKLDKALPTKSNRVRRKRLQQAGPLFVDEKHKKAGMHYYIVNDEPGMIKRFEGMGYSIVHDSATEIGDTATSGKFGSAVTVEVGRTSQLTGVLMEIDDEGWQEIREELQEKTDAEERQISETGIPTQYGDITRETK